MNRLVLIDGNAILHRAFHALPPLTTKDGKPVQAIYGFVTMLLRLVHDLNPTHLAVAFDRPAPTFRKNLFKDYQAKRPKMDDELVLQVDGVHDILRAFQIPIFEMDGYEADDILGTLCQEISNLKSQKNKNIDQIIIVTGDKDLLQLVEDDKVLVYMPVKGLSEGKLYGEKETEERLGVKPPKIPDLKALAGDASDNYPGIAGIGPKTAVEILKKSGSIEELYEHIGKKSFGLSENVVDKIKQGKKDALLSHQLATIKCDVPIETDIPDFSQDQLKTPEAIGTLQTFGFNSLIKRLGKKGNEEIQRNKDTKIQSEKEKNDETEQLSLV